MGHCKQYNTSIVVIEVELMKILQFRCFFLKYCALLYRHSLFCLRLLYSFKCYILWPYITCTHHYLTYEYFFKTNFKIFLEKFHIYSYIRMLYKANKGINCQIQMYRYMEKIFIRVSNKFSMCYYVRVCHNKLFNKYSLFYMLQKADMDLKDDCSWWVPLITSSFAYTKGHPDKHGTQIMHG
jgi:hypothetical protein